jgi:hypothetical protein
MIVKLRRTPGRNAMCPCGSGKKWKKCHGRQKPPPAPEDAIVIHGIVFDRESRVESGESRAIAPASDSPALDSPP